MPPLGPTSPFTALLSSSGHTPTRNTAMSRSSIVEEEPNDDSEYSDGSHLRNVIDDDDYSEGSRTRQVLEDEDGDFSPLATPKQQRERSGELTSVRLSFLETAPNLVVLNVGGREFIENEHLLGCGSLYFELGLQEQETNSPKSFDFPNKDPREWEFVRQLLIPFATEKITLRNSRMVLPWLEDLGISRGLTACDQLYLEEVFAGSLCLLDSKLLNAPSAMPMLQDKLTTVLESLEVCLQYNLMLSKNSFFSLVKKVIQDHPELLTIVHCSTIGAMVTFSHEGQRELWDSISVYLPEDVKVIDQAMASKAVFGKVVYAGIQAHLAISSLNAWEKLIFTWWTGWKKRHEPIRGSYRRPGVETEETKKEAHAIEESLRSLNGGARRSSTLRDSFTAANHSMLLSE